nr:hypothetical protein [Tanacetum cinerariifolium]
LEGDPLSIDIREGKFDGSTFCEDDATAALVDEFANGLTNVLPSTIAFGLSSSTSCEMPLTSDELEVLEQAEHFPQKLTVDHQSNHHT